MPGCFEVNINGTEAVFGLGMNGPLNAGASRLSTTIHDITDDFNLGVSHNGYVWAPVPCGAGMCPSPTTLVPLPGPSAGLGEESVTLPLITIPTGIALWMNDQIIGVAFATDTLMLGLTRAMRFFGVPDMVICNLYALHSPTGACPPNWMAL